MATVLFVREIMAQSALLNEQVTALAQDQAQQTQLARLQKLTTETAADRDELNGYYLASQSDSIDFLNFIEALADQNGVELVTNSATENERRGGSELTVRYGISGTEAELDRFVRLLETMPYVSELTALTLTKQTGVTWDADVTVSVYILPSV